MKDKTRTLTQEKEKLANKIQHPFWIKITNKFGVEAFTL